MGHVLIVGAGPAGASLARLLVSRGIDVTLLERQKDFSREFRGEILMPSGLDALHQMGMTKTLEGVPQELANKVAVYLNGQLVFREVARPEIFPHGLPRAMSQPGLLEALVGEASQSPRMQLYRGASARELLFEEDRVVGVRARTEAGERDLHADLVIGADGRYSLVRKHGGFTSQHTSPPLDVVWCKLPDLPQCQEARAYMGHGHFLLCYRSWDARLQVAWIIVKGSYADFKTRGREEWLESMEAHVSPDLAQHIRTHRHEIDKPFLLDSVADRVDCWSKPGVLLVGDAAHTMSPVGGQGINVALRDVIVAANHLVPVLSGDVDPIRVDDALLAIERERMPEIQEIQKIQGLPPRVGFNQAWWGEPLRQFAALLLARPRFRNFAGRRSAELFFGVTRVELRV